jgi:hypothetical protein
MLLCCIFADLPVNGAPITLVLATLADADLKTMSVYAHARPGVANVGAVAVTTRRTIASDAKEALFGDMLKQQLRMGPDPDDPVRLFSRRPISGFRAYA